MRLFKKNKTWYLITDRYQGSHHNFITLIEDAKLSSCEIIQALRAAKPTIEAIK